jgi:predicted transcriptional regulator of viral defense system
MRKSFENARRIFLENNGILRNSQAKSFGIDPQILAQMTKADLLIRESRGLYRLADLPPFEKPDLALVSSRIRNAVICLISALNFHDLTTQIPYRVFITLPRGIQKPRLEYPPLEVVWLSKSPYNAGIKEYFIDGIVIKVYDREKTIADCFKFRNKIGKNIAIEALKDYLRKPERDINKLLHYAKIDRVEKIIRPYIEALV